MGLTRRNLGNLFAALYLAGGALVLWDFVAAPPDGLANVGLALHVFPMTVLGLVVGGLLGLEFPFFPASYGYYGAHIAFFVPSLILCALVLRRVVGGARNAGSTRSPDRHAGD